MLEDLLFANETLEEGDGLAGGDANRQGGSDADRASGQKRQVRGLASASLSHTLAAPDTLKSHVGRDIWSHHVW